VGLGPPTVVRLEGALAHRSAPNRGRARGSGQAWGTGAVSQVAGWPAYRPATTGRRRIGRRHAAEAADTPPAIRARPRGRAQRVRVGPSTVRPGARQGQTATDRHSPRPTRRRIVPVPFATVTLRHADKCGHSWQDPRAACGQPLDACRAGTATVSRIRRPDSRRDAVRRGKHHESTGPGSAAPDRPRPSPRTVPHLWTIVWRTDRVQSNEGTRGAWPTTWTSPRCGPRP
jgi:hypothetical protein